MSVELVWPLECNLDVVVGSIWRLTGRRNTHMTSQADMSGRMTGVRKGARSGVAEPTSGFGGCFYGETDLNGEWRVRWLRDHAEYGAILSKEQRCKKCDAIIVPLNAAHPTRACPYVHNHREARHEEQNETHKQTNGQTPIRARLRRQPGDGSCLFHSVGYHVGKSGSEVRRQVVDWMKQNQTAQINGSPLHKWLEWDGGDAAQYVRRLGSGAWGGGIELAALTHLYPSLSFEVFRHRDADRYDRVARFGDGPRTVSLCWSGSHYDALE